MNSQHIVKNIASLNHTIGNPNNKFYLYLEPRDQVV